MWEREYRIEHGRVERLTGDLLEAKKQLREWLAANGPGGWIDDLRKPSAVTTSSPPPCGCATATDGLGNPSKVWCARHWLERGEVKTTGAKE